MSVCECGRVWLYCKRWVCLCVDALCQLLYRCMVFSTPIFCEFRGLGSFS